MAKVLTEEDFQEGEHKSEDTSKTPEPQKEVIEGKEQPEPEAKEEPSKDREEPQPKPSEDKKYKYASMDEFDKAYKEAERKMHEATTEKAQLSRELEQYRKPKESPVTIDDRIKEMTKDTLTKIRVLPSDSPTREEDAGYLWAKLQSDISDVKYEERHKKEESERSVAKKLFGKASTEGLKSDDELDMVGFEFSRIDPGIPTEDRISQAVEITKGRLSRLRDGLVEKQKKDEKDKEDLKVLGRGSSRREKSEEVKEEGETMSQALTKLNEQRKMKKEDLRW